jgi:hypothetical protein
VGIVIAATFKPTIYPPFSDGVAYFMMANHDYSANYGYYGTRLLHPIFVSVLSHITGMPVDANLFLLVAMGALVTFFLLLGVDYSLEGLTNPGVWLLLPATATLVDQYRNYYWHDMFYAVLCALFFLVLRENLWLGLPIVLALYLTRESTIILIPCLVAVALLRRQWAFGLSALVAGILAMLLSSHLNSHALTNRQGVPMLVLDALKMPFNFALNVCGLEFWANTNAGYLGKPRWIADVPSWLHLGNIHQVGYVGFTWQRPVQLLVILLSAFGTLPVLVGRVVASGWSRRLLDRFDYAVAFAFGATMFFLAPLQGTTPARYVFYAWPVFWIFGVAALNEVVGNKHRQISLVLLSLVASWVPAFVRLLSGPKLTRADSLSTVSSGGLFLSLLLLIPIYLSCWRLSNKAST